MKSFIEVCSGAGGLSLGFIQAGFNPLLLVDNDQICCCTLQLNHKNTAVKCQDMTDLNLSAYYDQVDVLIGGLPCQSFSIAGKRTGLNDLRGNLFFYFPQLVTQCHCKMFVIENVKGLLSHNKGNTIKEIINILSINQTYKIFIKVLNAKDYNVPQKRERVFIVGIRSDIYDQDFIYPPSSKEVVLLHHVLTDDIKNAEGSKYSTEKLKIMSLVPSGGCWINLPIELQKEYLGNSFYSSGGRRGIARRLSMDELCLTLTTSACQKQTERCHPTETRPLNIKEYARIQTFPDHYLFHGTLAQRYKQIGNAVPVKLAYAIAMSVSRYLDKM